MPRGFASAGARPATTRTTVLPGPSHDTEDALLKARLSTLNTTPFTAEHMAAYAAFASITDRKTALDLHRHGVTWDDVNDYPDAGGILASDFATMKRLSLGGLRPAILRDWNQMCSKHLGVPVHPESLIPFVQAGISIEQAEPYYVAIAAHPNLLGWVPADIVRLVGGNIDVATACEFGLAGIRSPGSVVYLHRNGCRPTTVADYARAAGKATDTGTFEREFTNLYMSMSAVLDRPALVRVAVANNATHEAALAWNATGESLMRVDLFMKARVSADEWNNDPTVREADAAALAMLAALTGHSGVTVAA